MYAGYSIYGYEELLGCCTSNALVDINGVESGPTTKCVPPWGLMFPTIPRLRLALAWTSGMKVLMSSA